VSARCSIYKPCQYIDIDQGKKLVDNWQKLWEVHPNRVIKTTPEFDLGSFHHIHYLIGANTRERRMRPSGEENDNSS
jgi:hypothetical protein